MKKTILPRLRQLLAEHLEIDESEITLSSTIQDHLGADSLAFVEALMLAEEQFGIANSNPIPDELSDRIKTVGDLVNAIALLMASPRPTAVLA